MPWVSKRQARWGHSPAGLKALGGAKKVAEWDSATPKGSLKKKKYKLVINNKLRGSYGAMDPKTNKIEVNVKGHHGDKAELASTIKHELLHVKHPKMTEKMVYKKSAKTKIPEADQHKLISKLRNKARNYKVGALKRKYKLGREDTKPGDLFNQARGSEVQVAIRGLV